MKDVYIIKHHFSGPDNISINQLTETDLCDLLSALRVADCFIPVASTQLLASKIECFLEIHQRSFD